MKLMFSSPFLRHTGATFQPARASSGVSRPARAPRVNQTPEFRDCFFLAVSQSGRSPDLLRLTEAARAGNAFTAAITNDETSPLAGLGTIILSLHAGEERAVPATKTFIASLVAVAQLTGFWADDRFLLATLDRLPNILERAAMADWTTAASTLASAQGV